MSSPSYFDRFAEFDHNPHAALLDEFDRLSASRQWKHNGKRYLKEKMRCCAEEVHTHFGEGVAISKLGAAQELCEEIGIEVPATITQCKKVLSKVAVNIIDLIDSRRTGTPVRRFVSRAALRAYTKKKGRRFPKDAAKINWPLGLLLDSRID
ncbi:hypothetical protein K461DRAFT_253670 [Myriangium duriaei CBS 260.36]|uniref:Uncharacterized protein n=1 Tax=Myriangium duriaei CBS 260.36 TaxID=1168546 RepID=A0A9P4MNE7_9PEZI|nr:hypothetical protein K461DRAFT_253670 [Myriangium duriaei CBS 260.36]